MIELLRILKGYNIFIGVEIEEIYYDEQNELLSFNDFLERVDMVLKMKKLDAFVT